MIAGTRAAGTQRAARCGAALEDNVVRGALLELRRRSPYAGLNRIRFQGTVSIRRGRIPLADTGKLGVADPGGKPSHCGARVVRLSYL
jgi:hypothetical protein